MFIKRFVMFLVILMLAAFSVSGERLRPVVNLPNPLQDWYIAEPFYSVGEAANFLVTLPEEQRKEAVLVHMPRGKKRPLYLVGYRAYKFQAVAIPRSVIATEFPEEFARERAAEHHDWYKQQGIPAAIATTASDSRFYWLVFSETGWPLD